MTDFDMENAHPVILAWVCSSLRVSCPRLEQYIHDRDSILNTMVCETGKSRKECKMAFLVSINTSNVLPSVLFPYLKDLDSEMKVIQHCVTQHQDYKWLRCFLDVTVDNYRGRFLNRVLCYHENTILEIAIAHMNDKKKEIAALMFDGLMIYGDIYNTPEEKEICNDLNLVCKKEYGGIDIRWTTKSLEETTIQLPPEARTR